LKVNGHGEVISFQSKYLIEENLERRCVNVIKTETRLIVSEDQEHLVFQASQWNIGFSKEVTGSAYWICVGINLGRRKVGEVMRRNQWFTGKSRPVRYKKVLSFFAEAPFKPTTACSSAIVTTPRRTRY
jgi:hypothetical protein